MVCFAVVANIVITSGHLETASIMMKNIFPMKGPAKSTVVASMGRLAIPKDVRVQLQGKLVCLDKLYTTWPDLQCSCQANATKSSSLRWLSSELSPDDSYGALLANDLVASLAR